MIDITTDLVNDECVVTDSSMLYSLRRSCLVRTADSCKNEGRFRCDQVIIWMCFLCLLAKQLSAFKVKRRNFGSLFTEVVQKHTCGSLQVGCGSSSETLWIPAPTEFNPCNVVKALKETQRSDPGQEYHVIILSSTIRLLNQEAFFPLRSLSDTKRDSVCVW